jgi:hypothetical protein
MAKYLNFTISLTHGTIPELPHVEKGLVIIGEP